MPDYNALRDALTSSFENAGLSTSGFYFDDSSTGYKLNVGYGFNITDNLTIAKDALETAGIHATRTVMEPFHDGNGANT